MKKLLYLYFIILLASCSQKESHEIVFQAKVISDGWEVTEEGKDKWYPARVPGSVHLDLFRNQVIPDPFYENNEQELRWMENKNWSYRTTLEVDSLNLSAQRNSLRFNGLDTYAKVYLNGALILTANNMFRTWEVPVKELLKLGINELRVDFESPILHHKQAVENYPYSLPSGNESASVETKVSNFSRKAAYQFGWDFAPRFVTSGIWKPIELLDWNYARIKNVYTYTKSIGDDVAQMETQVEIEAISEGEYELVIDGICISPE
jgi:beta-mannosidase